MIIRKILLGLMLVVFAGMTMAQTPIPTPIDTPPTPLLPTALPPPDYDNNQLYPIVIPRYTIERGQQITANMLTTIQMQGDFLAEVDTNPYGTLITESSMIIGSYAQCDLNAFEPIDSQNIIDDTPRNDTISCQMIPRSIPRSLFDVQGVPLEVGSRGALFVETAISDTVSLMLPIIPDAEITEVTDDSVTIRVRDNYRTTSLIFALIDAGMTMTLSPQPANFREDFLFVEVES